MPTDGVSCSCSPSTPKRASTCIYSFMKDGVLENFTIRGVTQDDAVPSITDRFLAAFVFENEIHDLFGVNVRDIAIDFGGNFYALAQKQPMTIISPAQKAPREGRAARQGRARKKAPRPRPPREDNPGAAAARPTAPPSPAEGIEAKLAGHATPRRSASEGGHGRKAPRRRWPRQLRVDQKAQRRRPVRQGSASSEAKLAGHGSGEGRQGARRAWRRRPPSRRPEARAPREGRRE